MSQKRPKITAEHETTFYGTGVQSVRVEVEFYLGDHAQAEKALEAAVVDVCQQIEQAAASARDGA